MRAFNDLLDKVRTMLADWDGLSDRYRTDLANAVRDCDDARATTEEIEAARQTTIARYGGDDVEIDDDALCSRPMDDEGGFWVQGWLWVHQERAEEEG